MKKETFSTLFLSQLRNTSIVYDDEVKQQNYYPNINEWISKQHLMEIKNYNETLSIMKIKFMQQCIFIYKWI
jgi:hypothetical protein